MKTIIVPTDFSEPAENAALYALNLAFIRMPTYIFGTRSGPKDLIHL
ncbi:hypothetical protein J8J42_01170 [Chryseobacterium sp. cx-311]|nr:hypothetical protein [Marnyiella aurantia]MBP0611653.1 hypothetical protein [Marnyiella aurantia]